MRLAYSLKMKIYTQKQTHYFTAKMMMRVLSVKKLEAGANQPH